MGNSIELKSVEDLLGMSFLFQTTNEDIVGNKLKSKIY